MIPISEAITVVITVKATASPVPFMRWRAKASTLLGFPPGSKFSPGSNIRQMPVKDLSKTSMGTV